MLELGFFNTQSPETYPEITGAWEVLPILVERHGHDAISGVECLLHTISMMDVNINVKNSLVVSEN